MANIPGISGTVAPGVYSRVQTITSQSAVPGGTRLPAIMGLGQRNQTIILSALGGGQDGVNPNFLGSNAPDGRHFQLSYSNLVPRQTTILLNGIPLTGKEQVIVPGVPFDSRYDYALNPVNGQLVLQQAFLVNTGGSYYVPGSSNVGNGVLSTLNLIDADAPTETWSLRVASVIRDAYGNPISGHASFTAIGSVSGQINDAYGNPIYFVSDGIVRSNGILQIAIVEGSTPFNNGDRFTIQVSSYVLQKGDQLTATYIPFGDLNVPTYFTDPNALYAQCGYPSLTNTLSLGAQLAFQNGAPGVWAVECAPPIAIQTTEAVVPANNPLTSGIGGFSGGTDVDSLSFPLTLGVPGVNTAIQLIVTDANSGLQTEVYPNKVPFYSSSIALDPYNNFINNPSTYTYSYTVVELPQVQAEGIDGSVVAGSNNFTAPSANFMAYNLDTAEDATNLQIQILSYDSLGNPVSFAGLYYIDSVGGDVDSSHIVTLTDPSSGGVLPFPSTAGNLVWHLVDPGVTAPTVLLTQDLVTSGTIAKHDGITFIYVDQQDETFFDKDWTAAFTALEAISCQIVVPLPPSDFGNIQQAGLAHVEAMSSTLLKQERLLFTGAQQGVTTSALLGNSLLPVDQNGFIIGQPGASTVSSGATINETNFDISTNFGSSFRVVYFYPDQVNIVVNGTSSAVHGFYMAACAAGYFAGVQDYSVALTNKALIGFNIDNSHVYSPTVINQVIGNGVTLVTPITGGGLVVWGITTVDSGSPVEQEISVVFIRDYTVQQLRLALQSFIGQPAGLTIGASILSKAAGVLNGLVGQQVLTSYSSLTVSRDTVEPRQFDVSVAIVPILPVDFIFINVGVTI